MTTGDYRLYLLLINMLTIFFFFLLDQFYFVQLKVKNSDKCNQRFEKPLMTSSYVLFRPQPKDIQLTEDIEE